MGQYQTEEVDAGFPEDIQPKDTHLPWIDIHGHHHQLTWNALEQYALTGCRAVVMAVGNVGAQTPYRPITGSHVQSQWDRVIRACHTIGRSFPFEAHAAVGVHTTNGPVEDIDTLLELLPAYLDRDEIIAASEIGITTIQEHETLPLDTQRQLLQIHLEQAIDAGIPAVIHTPTIRRGQSDYAAVSTETHTTGSKVLDPETAKLDGTKLAVQIAEEVGFPHSELVLTHGHRTMAPWVLNHTDCYVSFTIGPATRDVMVDDVRSAIESYGADRIMLDTDAAAIYGIDPFEVKRTAIALIRAGIDPADVRQIVYENPRSLLGLDHLEA